MHISQGNMQRTVRVDLMEYRRFGWMMLTAGLAGGLLAMHLMVVRPMNAKVGTLRTQLVVVENELDELVGESNQAWQTNNLLSALRSHHRQLSQASASLATIRQFRQDVETEAKNTKAASATLDRLASLQGQLIGQDENADIADRALKEMIALRNGLIEERQTLPDAIAALNEIADVLRLAASESAEAELAESGLKQLTALRTQLTAEADHLPAAQESATKLIALREQLSGNSDDFKTAEQNLTGLLRIQSNLGDQTIAVADAVQTLEILTDFNDEIRRHVNSLQGIRLSLMEIALMETVVGRVARTLDPLIQIGNLRRLGDAEIREAARVILKGRASKSRLSRYAPEAKPLPVTGRVDAKDSANEEFSDQDLVPWPLGEE